MNDMIRYIAMLIMSSSIYSSYYDEI